MSELIFCETCGESVEKRKYTYHLKYGHVKKEHYSCNICQKLFESKNLKITKITDPTLNL